jgi:acetyltransferase
MTPLLALLEPRSIVLMGASEVEGFGAAVAANLRGSKLAGGVFLIGSDDSVPLAELAYRDVRELPMTPDLAVICGPAAAVAEALDQAGRKGTKTAVVTTVDPDGPDAESALKRSLRQAGKRHGCRFLGPGSAGINMPVIGLNASWMRGGLAAGKLALVSQSASVASSVGEWAISRGIGLSRVISMGEEADIGVDEVLRQLAADPRTTGILLYLRSPSRGRVFFLAARAAGRIKPILVLKPREPSLSGDYEPYVDPDDVYDAVFNRAGLLRVDDAAEWFDAAESLSRARQLRVGNVAIVSNGSGPARLAAAPLAAERLC